MRKVLRRLLFCLIALLLGGTLLGYIISLPSTLTLGRWLTAQPVERRVVPLAAMGRALPLAVIASEDARFCEHHGVDWQEMSNVIEHTGESGRLHVAPSRGASTIAMQTAKNVFLWPGHSYLRKALEMPLALWLDAVWGKRRLLETYLNLAEWGDGLYGAEAAAQHYFHKPTARLTRSEAALLASALPSPLTRHPDTPSAFLRGHADMVMSRMSDDLATCLK